MILYFPGLSPSCHILCFFLILRRRLWLWVATEGLAEVTYKKMKKDCLWLGVASTLIKWGRQLKGHSPTLEGRWDSLALHRAIKSITWTNFDWPTPVKPILNDTNTNTGWAGSVLKGTCHQPDNFSIIRSYIVERERELAPPSCPLTSTLKHTCTHTNTCMYVSACTHTC